MKLGRTPTGPMRSIIRTNSDLFTVYRPQTTTDSLGQTQDDVFDESKEKIWVFNPRTETVQADFGERLEGELAGIGLPDIDVKKEDEIEYQGQRYTVMDKPIVMGNDIAGEFKTFNLEKNQD